MSPTTFLYLGNGARKRHRQEGGKLGSELLALIKNPILHLDVKLQANWWGVGKGSIRMPIAVILFVTYAKNEQN